MKKIISFILVLATVLGCLAALPFGTWAEELASGELAPLEPVLPVKPSEVVSPYLNQSYPSAEAKLKDDKNMKLMVSNGVRELYANAYTGEVYIKDIKTGKILHSNPYNMEGSSDANKQAYMSQIMLRYVLAETSKGQTDFTSYQDSAMHGQITIDTIADGIRVNYALGNTTKRYLLPYGIMANDMIDLLFTKMHKDIVETLREEVTLAGLPQQYIDSYFDFEDFCKKPSNLAMYSTINSLGRELDYGNNKAFDAWLKNALDFYNNFYTYEDYELLEQKEDPIIKRENTPEGKEWQAARKDKSALDAYTSDYKRFSAVFTLASPYLTMNGDDPSKWEVSNTSIGLYPILGVKGDHSVLGKECYVNSIYVLDRGLTPNRYREIEALFAQYVSGYTLTKATAAEDETGVYPPNNDSPVFYVSLEYKLTEDGFTAEVPATSIMYDESTYKITRIDVLPFMGSADVREDGYIFFPDGSGSVIDFAEFRSNILSVSMDGKIYGEDYAKYVIEGLYQKNVSMPVFGTVYSDSAYEIVTPYGTFPCGYTEYKNKDFEITYTYDKQADKYYACLPYGKQIETSSVYILNDLGYYDSKSFSNDEKNEFYYGTVTTKLREKDFKLVSTGEAGYLGIVEEGAALSTIVTEFNGSSNWMSRLGIRFVPRGEDKYILENEKNGDLEFTVQAKNKYMGSYKVRYIMLTDEKTATASGLTEYYLPSYVGMAAAYQNYLVKRGMLPKSADVNDQLPLIIENFGVMQTQKKFLSIPFTVDVALTTFKDVETMYNELEAMGIKNVKFRLTGFINGGMESTYPVKIKWEGEVGGKSGFKDLLAFADDETRSANGMEIYPNFNFMYIRQTGSFDGISLKKIGARCADNRYAIRASYSSIYQSYVVDAMDGFIVSAAQLEGLFAKFNKKYSKYDHATLSMNAMASDLSGDFDEDNGITREESLNYITGMLDAATASYSSIMTEGGNLYALKYMSYLVEAPLDSSHFKFTSRTVPFWGMVVHGHIQYAGEAFNEQANKDEALLQAIESGANLYFTLSYNDTQLMKDDYALNKYYSVDYQISKGTVEEYYKKLNAAIGDLQNYRIVDHSLLFVERDIQDADITAQLRELEAEFLLELAKLTEAEQEEIRSMILALRTLAIDANDQIAKYDADRDGILNEAEINTSWNAMTQKARDAVKAVVRAYYTNSVIADIIGGAKLDIDDNAARDAAETAASKLVIGAIVNGTLDLDFGQTVGVAFDEEAVIASACRMLDVNTLRDEFVAEIRAYMAKTAAEVNAVDFVAKVSEVSYTPAHSYFTTSTCLDQNYKTTESTISNGTVVMVTYSNGTDTVRIILNYNVFAVNVNFGADIGTVHLDKYGYMRLD